MRGVVVASLTVFVVVAFFSAGCSRRSKKHKKEPLQITTTSLPDATEGIAYSYTLQAAGGNSSNYNWSISGQPSWLSIDASTGELSGTPPAGSAGSYTFTVEVTDGQQTASKQFDLTVKPAGSLTITTTSLPDATEGVTYSATIEAAGGTTPYTWTVSGLPSGLSWTQVGDAVEISGTPDVGTAGTYNVDVTVTDSSSPNQSASATLQLVVNSGGGGATLKAEFEATPTYGKAPLAVTFTDKSTGNPTSWEWDFDNDGTVDSTDQNPQWTYSSPGWYTVKLTVSDGTNSDTCVKEKYILVGVNVYYVDGVNGDDGNGGTGWGDAFATIGKALSVAGDYDLVLVADATYNETDLDFGGKRIYLKGVDHNNAGAQPIIDCQGSSGAFYFSSGETKDSVVDNFTIKNGGALDGGAICCDSSSPTITNCTFSGNGATGSSGCCGAIGCWNSSSPTITNCTFMSNRADMDGGAIGCNANSNPTIANCTFSGNSAGAGGAICCNSSSPSITNCVFKGNSAGSRGGAICCRDNSSPTVTNCTFSGNSARWGGAVDCTSSGVNINGCAFNSNSADLCGGAICCDSSDISIVNCVFYGNSAEYGGAIECWNASTLKITNCTFSDNSASDKGGAVLCLTNSRSELNNCILWNNFAGSSNEVHIEDSGSSCALNYCCVDRTGYGGYSGNITENNCIHDDPQFVDAVNGDYHLKPISPCIDAGDNGLVPSGVDEDLDGSPRKVDGDGDQTATVDIGAYEFHNTLYVDGVNGSDANDGSSWTKAKKTIQAGIDAAGDYWAVFVADATYNETNLDFGGKKIYLKGVDHHSGGLTRPVIDCQQLGRAFYFHTNEDEDSVIDNFVIKNGMAEDSYGGGIVCYGASPTIMNCVFENNKAVDTNATYEGENGGAVWCSSGSPRITNCVFSGNSADWRGGALFCYSNSSPTVTNCTISGNSADYGGGVYCSNSSNPTLNNCILWDNSAPLGGDEILAAAGCTVTLNYCCVDNTGYGGGGTIDENNCIYDDPQFVDPANGNYHLKDTSPCIDEGDNSLVPSGVTTDLDGEPRIVDGDDPPDGTATVDIGAYEYQP